MTTLIRFPRNIAFVDVDQPGLAEDAPFAEYVVHGAVYYPRMAPVWDESPEPAGVEYEGVSLKGQLKYIKIPAATHLRVLDWLMAEAENT